MLQITEHEINFARFLTNRNQLIAEKLPVFDSKKSNIAEIVDEYLGISIR